MSRSVSAAVAAVLAAAVATGAAVTFLDRSRQPAGAGPRPPVVRAFDEPDAAAAYYAARRAPSTPGIDPQERYRTALARLDRMPRFSTPLGRRELSLRDSGGRLVPLAWPFTAAGAARGASPSLDTWIPLGPGNVGGRTRVMGFHPLNANRMYAGGVSGGVWVTDDAGGSWRPVGDRLSNLAVNAMAIGRRSPYAIYVGTGEGYFREEVRYTGLPLRGGGIFTSADGGSSWSQLRATSGPDFQFVNDLLISANDDRVLYAATRTGVWRSRDGGASWASILPATVRGGCLDLALRTDRPDDVLLASCGTFEQATVYRTLDARGAAVFTAVLSDPGMGRTALAIAPNNQDVVYALAASNLPGPSGLFEQGLHALFRSAEGGAAGTWSARVRNSDASKLNTLILTNPIAAAYADCRMASSNSYSTMGWYVNTVAVDPADADTVWAAGVDWFRSRDGGRTWGLVSEWWRQGVGGFAHADQHGLVFDPGYNGTSNQRAFALTDGGIYRTDNARGAESRDVCNPASIQVAWTSLNHAFGVTQFYHGLPFPGGGAYLGGTQDNGTLLGTASGGIDGWVSVSGGDGAYVAIDPADPRVIHVQSQWANIRRSEDGGRTFVDATDGLEPRRGDGLRGARADFLFITPLALDPGRPDLLWTGGRYIYRRGGATRTGDDGDQPGPGEPRVPAGDDKGPDDRRRPGEAARPPWQRVSDRLIGEGLVSAIAVSASSIGRTAVGATDGRIYVTEAGRSAPGAMRWEVARPREGWVTSVAFDPSDGEVLYATFGGFGGSHVFASANFGRTWRAIDGAGDTGIPDVPVHSIVADPDRPESLYLGTDLGVFVSHTAGDTWEVENTGFGAIVTEWLAPLRLPNGERWIYAFTHGRGAWKARVR